MALPGTGDAGGDPSYAASAVDAGAGGSAQEMARYLAHELRNPLAAIHGLALTITERDLSPETMREVARRLLPASRRALELVDSLMAMASTPAERPLRRVPTDLNRLVQEVLDDLSGLVTRTGSTVELRTLLPRMEADRVQLRQVLTNLVHNALVHGGGADGRAVHVTITGQTGDDGLTLRVADDGVGLDPAIVDRLFESGVRSADSLGLGIGLAAARDILRAHGGRLWVERAEAGTVMALLLPSVQTDGQRVLVVEDDVDLRRLYAMRLEHGHPGLEIVGVGSLAEAGEALERDDDFDLVLVDVGLPDGPGTRLLDVLGDLGIPALVVTGMARPYEVADARRQGVTVIEKHRDVLDEVTRTLRSAVLRRS